MKAPSLRTLESQVERRELNSFEPYQLVGGRASCLEFSLNVNSKPDSETLALEHHYVKTSI